MGVHAIQSGSTIDSTQTLIYYVIVFANHLPQLIVSDVSNPIQYLIIQGPLKFLGTLGYTVDDLCYIIQGS